MKKRKIDWRKHLTPEERATVQEADQAKIAWLRLSPVRAMIVNRAIQRAKYRENGK